MANTPSKWGEHGPRDAGHDEMQMAIYEYLRDRAPKEYPVTLEGKSGIRTTYSVHFEFPLKPDLHIMSFADVAVRFEDKFEGRCVQGTLIYEIKPKIYSVGSLIRQLEAQYHIALKCRYLGRPIIRAVVPSTDPLLHMMHRLGRPFVAAHYDDGGAVSELEACSGRKSP